MTKIVALSALGAGAVGAGVAALRARQRRAAAKQTVDDFDLSDLDEPVIISEEVVVVTETPFGLDMEVYSAEPSR